MARCSCLPVSPVLPLHPLFSRKTTYMDRNCASCPERSLSEADLSPPAPPAVRGASCDQNSYKTVDTRMIVRSTTPPSQWSLWKSHKRHQRSRPMCSSVSVATLLIAALIRVLRDSGSMERLIDVWQFECCMSDFLEDM